MPQKRDRVYVIGIRRDVLKHDFTFPSEVPCVPLHVLLNCDDKGADGLWTLPRSKTAQQNVTRALDRLLASGQDPRDGITIVDTGVIVQCRPMASILESVYCYYNSYSCLRHASTM